MIQNHNLKLIDLDVSPERMMKMPTPDHDWLIFTVGHSALYKGLHGFLGLIRVSDGHRGTAGLFG